MQDLDFDLIAAQAQCGQAGRDRRFDILPSKNLIAFL